MRRDRDLGHPSLGKLHSQAPEVGGERDVRPEGLEILAADRRDVDRIRDHLALERRGNLLGDDHARAVLRLGG